MATDVNLIKEDSRGVLTAAWNDLLPGESGEPITIVKWTSRTAQVEGTFDTGTLDIEGSNDGLNWHTLFDMHGRGLNFDEPGVSTIGENPVFLRPSFNGGGAAGSLKVLISRSS